MRLASRLQVLPLVCLLVSAPVGAGAEPYVPQDPNEVLTELLSRENHAVWLAAKEARKRLAEKPQDSSAAADAAKASIELFRAEADLRFLGHAESAISRWSDDPDPPVEILILRATIKQSRHDFSAAIDDLRKALERRPEDSQAWLTLASALITTGDFEGGEKACERIEASLYRVACASLARSMRGRLEESYRTLLGAYRSAGRLDPGTSRWILGMLGEMAERLGRTADAQEHYDEAKRLGPLDSFLTVAYGDFLLENGRAREARFLLEPHGRNDGALVRLAIAFGALGEKEALRDASSELQSRFERIESEMGSSIHLRELAMFLLKVKGDVSGALSAARKNFGIQKEAVDIKVLAEAVAASGDAEAAARLLEWRKSTGYEDLRIQKELEAAEVLVSRPGGGS